MVLLAECGALKQKKRKRHKHRARVEGGREGAVLADHWLRQRSANTKKKAQLREGGSYRQERNSARQRNGHRSLPMRIRPYIQRCHATYSVDHHRREKLSDGTRGGSLRCLHST